MEEPGTLFVPGDLDQTVPDVCFQVRTYCETVRIVTFFSLSNYIMLLILHLDEESGLSFISISKLIKREKKKIFYQLGLVFLMYHQILTTSIERNVRRRLRRIADSFKLGAKLVWET